MEKSDRKEKIRRESVYVDKAFVDLRYPYKFGGVTYGLYTANDLKPPDIPKLTKAKKYKGYKDAACFYALMDALCVERKVGFNRIHYDISICADTDSGKQSSLGSNITIEEAKRWLQLLKEHKIIPKYVDENVLHDPGDPCNKQKDFVCHDCKDGKYKIVGTIVLELDGLSPAQLYMYLSSMRDMVEYGKAVKWVIYLVDKCGIDFYAAYAFSCKICSVGGGHHFINLYRGYGSDVANSYQLMTIPISMAIGVCRFAMNPKRYDPRDLFAPPQKSKYSSGRHLFNCASTIQSISKVSYECTLDTLTDESIVLAIRSLTDRIAMKHIDTFKKRESKIVYYERKADNVKKQNTNSG